MTTGIEWTDETWSPTVGCSRVSPGCDGCYAEREARRQARNPDYDGVLDDERRWSGRVNCLPDRLEKPLHWRKPRRVFVDSMSDLFHPDVPDEFIHEVWQVMRRCPQHTFQVLTKRPQRMRALCEDRDATPEEVDAGYELGIVTGLQYDHPAPNVWLGVSAENQRYADLRIPHLLATPAAVRFVSAEPLLGPIDLAETVRRWRDGTPRTAGLDWVIVGGETGPNARPMHPTWARDLRDQCTPACVPYFYKQWGEWLPFLDWAQRSDSHACTVREFGDRTVMARVGKKRAGRLLDGRAWDEYPGAK
ncbi:MAG: phage Gp37/Gp68 family protein [Desulfobacterales bacterium]|nr:phage Gp37/Gp68 family protein [Desulfobacterales bacterium]